MKKLKLHKQALLFWGGIGTFIILTMGLFYYQYRLITHLSEELAVFRSDVASSTAYTNAVIGVLGENLSAAEKEAVALAEELNRNKEYVSKVESQVGGLKEQTTKISGSVGTLEKLSKTDPELLQKYSKVFFLNEHYQPPRLVTIDNTYVYNENQTHRIHASVAPYLTKLMDAAKADGVTLYVKSAFRSFDEQHNIKSSYSVTYGAGTANTFSADQGYSEHQLGTTVDFITTGLGGQLEGFDRTSAYTWLQNNAHRYGFALSYPANNSYYIFEPWHWRFVGTELATTLKNQSKYFYDFDQRTIDEYLVKIFD